MQRIEITSDGISVTVRSDPLVSVFGREMRPGVTDVVMLPWDEIVRVSLVTTEVPPDSSRWVELEIDVVWGEYFTVHEDAEGFAHAVLGLCQLSGQLVPECASSSAAPVTIWPANSPEVR
jgi:hypothetical protein